MSKKILIEVKTGQATNRDFQQLENYVNEVGKECVAGIMISKGSNKKVNEKYRKLISVAYSFGDLNLNNVTFEELKTNFRLYRNDKIV
jgi:hypothetical protein